MKWFFLALAWLTAGCLITGDVIYEPSSDNEACMCPETDCMALFSGYLFNSSTADCALYNVDAGLIEAAIKRNISIRIVTDDSSKIQGVNVRKDGSSGLMHNKFCVFDNDTVMTGSFNPVKASSRDNNNILILTSPGLVQNYQEEFNELWKNETDFFTEFPKVETGGVLIESYFCPDDYCADEVIEEIEKANKSIYFMTYSFTHQGIANSLIWKRSQGVVTQGLIEKNNVGDSTYRTLRKNNVYVKKDGNKALMHHKVFIIDSMVVITGSFNPTRSGDERNDENLLIIHSEEAALLFEKEFWRLFNASED